MVGMLQHAILTSANLSIIATDERGIIQIFNAGAERMLGYSAAEVLDKLRPTDLYDSIEVNARVEACGAASQTASIDGLDSPALEASRQVDETFDLTYICKDGTRFPALVSVTPLCDERANTIGYLWIGSDNSARKRVEKELNEAMAAAENANRAKSDFLSRMSHELRTPLNAILGFAQLMESGAPPPTRMQRSNLEQILKAGWYLLELINEILDLALIESGTMTFSREPVSLMEVVLEARALIEPQALKRGIRMTFPDSLVARYVSADRTRMKQVLINLLFNAIKYNAPGGTVVVHCSLVEPKSIRISIRDTGVGLSPAQVDQLFQPFNRLGKESGTEEGTGIGLVVTKRLMEIMGGKIGVESELGTGSTFWIELELADAAPLSAPEPDDSISTSSRLNPGTPQHTLLYVEDNPANLELVEILVGRRPDLRLLTAADGTLGIEFARAYQPAVILMDINLPGLSGTEAMKVLRADASTSRIPIVALSANAIPRDIERALAAGFFNYLTKPIKVDQFMDALDAALEHSLDPSRHTTVPAKT